MDDVGYYYYNTSDKSQKLRDLPIELSPDDSSRKASDGIYDRLAPMNDKKRAHSTTDDEVTPRQHAPLEARSSNPTVPVGGMPSDVELWSSRLSSSVQKKHGYLQKKKIMDPNGKK
jgi:hypothetical protein